MKIKAAICSVIILCLCACFCTASFADVLWTPNDTYYNNNYEDCDVHGRHYILNGAEGVVEVFSKPGGRTTACLPNGNKLFVSFITTDNSGDVWGVIQFNLDDNGKPHSNYDWFEEGDGIYTGWVRLDDMALVYDYISFEEEYGSEFYDCTVKNAELSDIDMVLWKYPGGEMLGDTMHIFKGNGMAADDGEEFSPFSHAWTDENGLEWGYVGYYYGTRQCWVCLSDPTSTSLPPVDRADEVNLIPPDMDAVKTPANADLGGATNYLVILAIAVVICSLGIIAHTLGKKNRA